jgi:hypothetical protein
VRVSSPVRVHAGGSREIRQHGGARGESNGQSPFIFSSNRRVVKFDRTLVEASRVDRKSLYLRQLSGPAQGPGGRLRPAVRGLAGVRAGCRTGGCRTRGRSRRLGLRIALHLRLQNAAVSLH